MKFKVGDKVRVIREASDYFGRIGIIEEVDKSYAPYLIRFEDGKYRWFRKSDLTPAHRTIDDVQKGDFVKNEYGKRKVIEVLGDIVFMSYKDDFDNYSGTYMKQQLKKDGYTLVQPKDTYEFEGKKYNLEQVREAIEGLEEVE